MFIGKASEQFLKIVFSSSSYSDKMRWERRWPKQLGLQQRSYSSKVKYIKIYPDIMIKTSRLHHWVNIGDFIAKFEIVFVFEINFGNHHSEKFLKISEVFERNTCGRVLL